MEADFWHQRWRDKLIGFHQPDVNARLKQYWPALNLGDNSRVLVPLCGKSLDLCWLAQYHQVCGVELSPQAIEEFFTEQKMEPRRSRAGNFDICEADRLSLLCGDFFDLDKSLIGPVGAVYDRAALVALPPEMRVRYVAHLNRLCSTGTRMLLISMAYPQSEMDGPPFSVEQEEIQDLFIDDWQVEVLETRDLLAEESKFRDRGLPRLEETVYRLTRM